MRPIIPLANDVAVERTVAVPVDEISIAPSIREVRDLLGYLESNTNLIQMTIYEHSVVDLEHEDVNNNKHKSFTTC